MTGFRSPRFPEPSGRFTDRIYVAGATADFEPYRQGEIRGCPLPFVLGGLRLASATAGAPPVTSITDIGRGLQPWGHETSIVLDID